MSSKVMSDSKIEQSLPIAQEKKSSCSLSKVALGIIIALGAVTAAYGIFGSVALTTHLSLPNWLEKSYHLLGQKGLTALAGGGLIVPLMAIGVSIQVSKKSIKNDVVEGTIHLKDLEGILKKLWLDKVVLGSEGQENYLGKNASESEKKAAIIQRITDLVEADDTNGKPFITKIEIFEVGEGEECQLHVSLQYPGYSVYKRIL